MAFNPYNHCSQNQLFKSLKNLIHQSIKFFYFHAVDDLGHAQFCARSL